MEDDVVLSDEMDQSRGRVLPPFLPILRQELLGIGNVADRGVEPDIKDLALGPVDRNRNAPVKISGHGTRLQMGVQPALALSIDVRLPFFVLFEDPVSEPWFIFIERQIPMFGLHLDRLCAAELGLRIDELLWAEGAAAFLALVAIGIRIAAMRAGAGDIAVGQEDLGLGVEILFALFACEFTLVVKFLKEGGGILFMDL